MSANLIWLSVSMGCNCDWLHTEQSWFGRRMHRKTINTHYVYVHVSILIHTTFLLRLHLFTHIHIFYIIRLDYIHVHHHDIVIVNSKCITPWSIKECAHTELFVVVVLAVIFFFVVLLISSLYSHHHSIWLL